MGEGGFGAVYQALDWVDRRNVAVKLAHVLERSRRRDASTREVALLAELRHPSIVRYVAHGGPRRPRYLVDGVARGQDPLGAPARGMAVGSDW